MKQIAWICQNYRTTRQAHHVLRSGIQLARDEPRTVPRTPTSSEASSPRAALRDATFRSASPGRRAEPAAPRPKGSAERGRSVWLPCSGRRPSGGDNVRGHTSRRRRSSPPMDGESADRRRVSGARVSDRRTNCTSGGRRRKAASPLSPLTRRRRSIFIAITPFADAAKGCPWGSAAAPHSPRARRPVPPQTHQLAVVAVRLDLGLELLRPRADQIGQPLRSNDARPRSAERLRCAAPAVGNAHAHLRRPPPPTRRGAQVPGCIYV